MKRLALALWLMAFGSVVFAQQPQTQTAPIYAVNAKYTNGVAPGYAPTAGTGLTLALGGGTANCSGTIDTYAGGTLALTANTTNYIYLNTSASCAPAIKTTAFTASDIPIATVVAGASSITSISDVRTMFTVTSSAGTVTSVFGRTGPVTAQTGDYTVSQITDAAGVSGTPVLGNCAKWASASTLGDAGSPCGSGGGGAPTGTGVPQVVSGSWGTTVDMGATANVPLVSDGAHHPALATGIINTGGTGTSIYNVATTVIANLGTLTGLTANVSDVQVTDGASCGDTGTGGGSVFETLQYNGAGWNVLACGPTGSVTANGLFSQIIFTPTTTGSGLTTALNQSATFSATNNATGITLAETTPQSGTNAAEGIVKAYPSSPFTLTFLFSLPQPPQSFTHFGIVVSTTAVSTSPAMEYFWGSGNAAIAGPQLNGVTNLTGSSTSTTLSAAITEYRWPAFIWLRWADDGTNITVSYSEDGSRWVQQYSVAKSASYLGASGFGFIGAFLLNEGAGAVGATLLSVH